MRKFIILACLLFCFSLSAEPLKTIAKNGVVIDYQTGQMLFEKNAFDEITPSAFAKLMTYYVVLEEMEKQKIDMEEKFFVSKKAIDGLDVSDTVFLKVGQRVKVEELLEAVAITYSVEACKVLAENIAGSEIEFVRLMNSEAKKLGMTGSAFLNSYGKDEKGQVMSAYDIAILLGKVISKYPDEYKSFNKKFFDFKNVSDEIVRKNPQNFWNKNKIIWDMKGADGGVVTYNRSAGYSIVASAVKDNKRLITVLYGMKLSGGRDEVNLQRAREAKKALNMLYDNYEVKTFFSQDKMVVDIQLLYGKNKTVAVYPDRDVYYVYLKDSVQTVELKISHFDRAVAPLKKGEVVGKIDMFVDGVKVDSFKLVIAENVRALSFGPARFFENLKQAVLYILGRKE